MQLSRLMQLLRFNQSNIESRQISVDQSTSLPSSKTAAALADTTLTINPSCASPDEAGVKNAVPAVETTVVLAVHEGAADINATASTKESAAVDTTARCQPSSIPTPRHQSNSPTLADTAPSLLL
ncbi:hypothetical protein GJ744_001723 [Endocarpon pusillum]|uniref:Uncharacterized protein n=1 Tax=Endocarpon pusillum TaxID=364733 RepID=A0A8H7E0Y6_9EURO|nr:hypothetical protein GJ744_001723 [Endocarpon pusillum]